MTIHYKYYIVFAVTLLLGVVFLSPFLTYGIYPDEVAVQIWTTRLWQDGPLRAGVHPQCASSFAAPIPMVLYVPAFFLSFFSFIEDIRIHRAFTSLLLIFFLYLVYRLLVQNCKSYKNVLFLFFILLGIGFSGTKLFSLVILRPEIFAVILILFGALVINSKSFFVKTAYVVFYSITIYMHPFAVYFLPAVMVVLKERFLLTGFGIFASYSAFQLWRYQLFKCSDQKIVKLNNSYNINPLTFLDDPIEFFRDVIDNLSVDRVFTVVNRLTINSNYEKSANYLPSFNESNPIFMVSNGLTLTFFVASLIYAIYFVTHFFLNVKSSDREGWYYSLVLVGVLVHMILNKTNSFYAVNFWYVILVSILFISLSKVKSLMETLSMRMVFIAASSAATFGIATNIFILAESYGHIGPNLTLLDKVYYSSSYRNLVLSKLRTCCDKYSSNSVVIDDATYFIMKNNIILPVPITYAAVSGNEEDVYRLRGVKYVIARCDAIYGKFGRAEVQEVEGGFGSSNVCIKKLLN